MNYKSIGDGGPAFPCTDDLGATRSDASGMTIRDVFAIAALQGMLARPNSSPSGHSKTSAGFSAAAYEFADEMLKARNA